MAGFGGLNLESSRRDSGLWGARAPLARGGIGSNEAEEGGAAMSTRRKARAKMARREELGLREIELPRPAPAKRSLASALQGRRTTREVSARALSVQTLSDLLWAACGVNRTRGPFGLPGRTAASASNSQEIQVYVAMEAGTYRYDPTRHRLLPAARGDVRPLVIGRGQAGHGSKAPVRLIYVVDIDRLVHTRGFDEPGLRDPTVQRSYYFVDTGLIAANVYLFAAARGLAAWFHNCDRTALEAVLTLEGDQRVLFGQTVGYPARSVAARS
jgi:Nitroreductase family